MIRKAWIALLLAAFGGALTACGGSGSGGTGGEPSVCGDGKVTGSEECDDENTDSGDGCDDECAVEDGYNCDSEPTICGPICGDGKLIAGEACDDGNTVAGDGCDAMCVVEDGFACAGEPSACAGICGDGKIKGAETCDDMNTAAGDGCDATCVIEDGYACTGEPSACATICGDGKIKGAEACDDGNTTAGDGCDAMCVLEAGFDCMGEPTVCTPICGDSMIVGTETCDDANTAALDGCDDACHIEMGWMCMGTPSVCTEICGDGLVVGAEPCDDMNLLDGDGCNGTCKVEVGWTCMGAPSVCTAICGDFLVLGAETCEDGNTAAGDGCSPTCTFEATCGNGVVEPGETCDDTNMNAGDGCDAGCKLEAGNTCGDAIDLNAMGVKTENLLIYDGTTVSSTDTTFGDPSCSAGTTGVKRVIHKYTVGDHSAVLRFEAAPVGGMLDDTVVWVYLNCQDTSAEYLCDDNSGPLAYSAFYSDVIPAGTTLFIVVSGTAVSDEGIYQLQITEAPAYTVPVSGTCAAPTPVGSGIYAGKTLMTDANNDQGSCVGNGPDGVFSFTLVDPADVSVVLTTNNPTFDMGLYLTQGPCGMGAEVAGACSNAAGAAQESFTVLDLPPGDYFLFADGLNAGDIGVYTLKIDIVSILPVGAPCIPASATQKCVQGAYCVGVPGSETCLNPAATLLTTDFDVDLSPLVVTDFGADNNAWRRCDPLMGCGSMNLTDSVSGGPFAQVVDKLNVALDGELMSTPALDATLYTAVVVEFDHFFDHNNASTDLGVVEASTDNVNWTTVASYTIDHGGHQIIDISAVAAGQAAFYVRFRYDDQTAGGDPLALSWGVDDLRILGF